MGVVGLLGMGVVGRLGIGAVGCLGDKRGLWAGVFALPAVATVAAEHDTEDDQGDEVEEAISRISLGLL